MTLLADQEPYLAAALPAVASFSMYPLLKKDGLGVAYAGALLCWVALAGPRLLPSGRCNSRASSSPASISSYPDESSATLLTRQLMPPPSPSSRWTRPLLQALTAAGAVAMTLIHAAEAFITPPERSVWILDTLSLVSLVRCSNCCSREGKEGHGVHGGTLQMTPSLSSFCFSCLLYLPLFHSIQTLSLG